MKRALGLVLLAAIGGRVHDHPRRLQRGRRGPGVRQRELRLLPDEQPVHRQLVLRKRLPRGDEGPAKLGQLRSHLPVPGEARLRHEPEAHRQPDHDVPGHGGRLEGDALPRGALSYFVPMYAS